MYKHHSNNQNFNQVGGPDIHYNERQTIYSVSTIHRIHPSLDRLQDLFMHK